ncbi:unnamed protein product, partial [marine sediment metagenome]
LVLVLHYLEGLSYDEVATFLDVPVGTVMSRMHRARQDLKARMTEMSDDEDRPMIPSEIFTQEVHAEISVLLAIGPNKPTETERLSVILRRSPERFAQLIEQTDEEGMLDNLSILLRRLGNPAIEIALESYFSGDSRTAAHASTVLRGFIAQCGSIRVSGWQTGMAARGAYLLADKLIQHPVEATPKAELLLEMIDAAEDDCTAVLLTNVLLCYAEAGFRLLMERFSRAGAPEDLYLSPHVLYALCRSGTPFCEELVKLFDSDDARKQLLALAGAEAM